MLAPYIPMAASCSLRPLSSSPTMARLVPIEGFLLIDPSRLVGVCQPVSSLYKLAAAGWAENTMVLSSCIGERSVMSAADGPGLWMELLSDFGFPARLDGE